MKPMPIMISFGCPGHGMRRTDSISERKLKSNVFGIRNSGSRNGSTSKARKAGDDRET